MYFVTETAIETENGTQKQFSVTDGITEYPCFTCDRKVAEDFIRLLNENEVEPNHLPDIVEDTFYT